MHHSAGLGDIKLKFRKTGTGGVCGGPQALPQLEPRPSADRRMGGEQAASQVAEPAAQPQPQPQLRPLELEPELEPGPEPELA